MWQIGLVDFVLFFLLGVEIANSTKCAWIFSSLNICSVKDCNEVVGSETEVWTTPEQTLGGIPFPVHTVIPGNHNLNQIVDIFYNYPGEDRATF